MASGVVGWVTSVTYRVGSLRRENQWGMATRL